MAAGAGVQLIDSPSGLTAALADRYRVERELGAGGMATVYLAHDLKHERDVAIKVLHPDLAVALGGERFLSEIKTTARLQHPHILPLLDSGIAGGFLFYVMPYVSGETLRSRLERERQLPIEDALRIAREVADALGAAHALGIVHRDIKPENILLQGGHALVADFGIALAVQSAGGARMTQTGLSLGTPQYMSPEQAMGEKSLDLRSDIYALGAVLFEMLAGDPPFTGSSVQVVVARLISEKPTSLQLLRDTVPPQVDAAVLRALAKLPADRFATAAEFAAALRSDGGFATMATATRESQSTGVRGTRLNGALATVTVAALAVAAWLLQRAPSTHSTAIFDAALPDSAPFSAVGTVGLVGFGSAAGNLSLAPDGTFAVYRVQRGDSAQLWYRSLVDATARPIPGTSGGAAPRISPDGRRIAFIAGDRTLIIPVAGGEPRRLMDGDIPVTLQWVSDTRLFAITSGGYRFTWLDAEVGRVEDRSIARYTRCVYGQWIVADEQLLCSFNETAVLVDPKSGELWPIRTTAADRSPGAAVSGSSFRLIGTDHIIYVSLDGELRAARYDRAKHQIGRSVSIVSGVDRDALGAATFDLAANGLLAFAPSSGSRDAQMVVMREGAAPAPLPIERAPFLRFDLSRDRRHLAAVVATPEGHELRIYDLRTGQRRVWLRAAYIRFPLWNPAGDRIAVRVENASGAALVLGSPTSSGALDTLMSGAQATDAFDAVHFVGEHTLLARDGQSPSMYRMEIAKRPVTFDTLFSDAVYATLAPDAKHIAWHPSNVSGLYVSDYRPGADRQEIGSNAIEPLWLSSNELLYRSGVTWFIARFDSRTGELSGAPTVWGKDQGFLDTPGWSNRLSYDRGIIYAQTSNAPDARFLRFVPDFVTRMKAAVRAADK